MGEIIVSTIVERAVNVLGQSIADTIASYFGGEDKLNELRQTMKFIQARLSDAERQQEGDKGETIKVWLRNLKSVMYRLEDLFDEQPPSRKQPRLVSSLFSCTVLSTSMWKNRSISKEAEAIIKDLNFLKDDMDRFHFGVHSINHELRAQDLGNMREGTDSSVDANEIIGRDDAKNVIVEKLLDSNLVVKEHLLVFPIVGMGGLGKTTLAQLVFNDQRVQEYFELKCWACISDQISSFEDLAGKVLGSITGENCQPGTLGSCLGNAVNGKKFLLVLDDVWDENRERWLRLKRVLGQGKQGSAILVTSRSKVVACNMATVDPYELKGLTEEKSWELFKALAFKEGQESMNPNFTRIGKEIIKKCGNVPLGIRVIAGILYSRDTEEEWLHFKDKEIGKLDQQESNIMPTLKLSYDYLSAQLKQCFAYCSLFPEDYEFDIQTLIWLWMAQGFVVSEKHESPYDVGYAYFMKLLRRSFFQDVGRDECGRMVSCKMHDLMHELAKVMGEECLLVDSARPMQHIDTNIRHVLDTNIELEGSQWFHTIPRSVRSYISVRREASIYRRPEVAIPRLEKLPSCLRVLDLSPQICHILPDSIGELKHLRYLKVRVHHLPKVITRLQRLETLHLQGCASLNSSSGSREMTRFRLMHYASYSDDFHELPNGFYKLTNLRHLQGTSYLSADMPPNFGQLKSLQMLSRFIVGENNGLDALSEFDLMGDLEIWYKKHRPKAISEAQRAKLKDKRITSLAIIGTNAFDGVLFTEIDKLLDCLQPPSTLKYLQMYDWPGQRISGWGMDDISCVLPNLVNIRLDSCVELRHLPLLSKLRHLKILHLSSLRQVEYVEVRHGSTSDEASSSSVSSSGTSITYFPSLENLEMWDMDELKGWSKIEYGSDTVIQTRQLQPLQHFFFRRLSKMDILGCPKLKSMPQMPTAGSLFAAHYYSLKELKLCHCENLDLWDGKDDDDISSSPWQCLKNLRVLTMVGIRKIESLPSGISYLSTLEDLKVYRLNNLKVIPESIEKLTQLSSLSIGKCPKLEALPRSICNLTALQNLHIWHCPLLKRRCEKPHGEDWPLIEHIPNLKITYIERY